MTVMQLSLPDEREEPDWIQFIDHPLGDNLDVIACQLLQRSISVNRFEHSLQDYLLVRQLVTSQGLLAVTNRWYGWRTVTTGVWIGVWFRSGNRISLLRGACLFILPALSGEGAAGILMLIGRIL